MRYIFRPLTEDRRSAIHADYQDKGWLPVSTTDGFAYMCPISEWVHFFDEDTGQKHVMSREKAKQLKRIKLDGDE